MREALDEARRGFEAGEVPVGAVVVLGGEIVGRARNAPLALSDPTAHAEVLALRAAGGKIGVARVVYGAPDPKAGGVTSLYRLLDDARLNHRAVALGGVLADESAALLRRFFETRR
jgi:tRNA(adenine34) deaminase